MFCFACNDKHVLAYTAEPNLEDDDDGDDELVQDVELVICNSINLKKKYKKLKKPAIICQKLNYDCLYGK